jgi:hypothetical protein
LKTVSGNDFPGIGQRRRFLSSGLVFMISSNGVIRLNWP